jgi:hypothetical protein
MPPHIPPKKTTKMGKDAGTGKFKSVKQAESKEGSVVKHKKAK